VENDEDASVEAPKKKKGPKDGDKEEKTIQKKGKKKMESDELDEDGREEKKVQKKGKRKKNVDSDEEFGEEVKTKKPKKKGKKNDEDDAEAQSILAPRPKRATTGKVNYREIDAGSDEEFQDEMEESEIKKPKKKDRSEGI